MKKLFALCLVAFLAISICFAGEGSTASSDDTDFSGSAVSGDTATLSVSLSVAADTFYGYYYGFCDDDPSSTLDNEILKEGLPVDVKTSVTMTMDTETKKADNTGDDVWLYYKLRSAHASTLTLKSSGLVESDNTRVVPLKVKIAGKETTCSEKTATTPVYTVDLGSGYQKGSQEITFLTDAIDGSKIGTYTASLAMVITTD